MIRMDIEGLEKLTRMAEVLETQLSVIRLTELAIKLAKEAGHVLLAESVKACIESIYDQPEGMSYERTEALLDAHRLIESEGGLEQAVTIDPTAEVRSDPHDGREFVIDYAQHVHDGYTQWVFGRETGQFTPGRFWFNRAEEVVAPLVAHYVEEAFFHTIMHIVNEATI